MLGAFSFALPFLAYAQEPSFRKLLVNTAKFSTILIPVAFTVVLLVFFFGVVKYVRNAGNEEAREDGRRLIIGGIIGIFVVTSIWGIIYFLRKDLGITDVGEISGPTACKVTKPPKNFADFLCILEDLIGIMTLIGAFFSLFAFVMGVAAYIWSAGNKEKVEFGRNIMIWGVIGLFVMTSIWGIVRFLARDIGQPSIGIPQLPQ